MPQDSSQASPPANQPPNGEPSDRSGARPNPLANPRVRAVLLGGGLIVLAAGAVLGFNWWTHGRFVQETDDAYLRADQVTIAPRVQGYIDQVLVQDNQDVVAGQPLARIEQRIYLADLAQQQANVDARQADMAVAQSQIALQQSVIAQNQARLAGARADAAFASREAARYDHMSAQGVETAEKAAQMRNQRDQALATEHADAAALLHAQGQIGTLKAQLSQARAQFEAAQAQVANDQQNLSDTLIRASITGRIGDRTLRVGQFVEPGTRLMTIVPLDKIYLVANFKETQIGRMRRGQPARIRVDAFNGRVLNGVVDSFSPGTGSEFALLPAENATGNFTKIVQRVPVRIRVIVPPDLRGRLLPGLSVTVSVDTTQPPVSNS